MKTAKCPICRAAIVYLHEPVLGILAFDAKPRRDGSVVAIEDGTEWRCRVLTGDDLLRAQHAGREMYIVHSKTCKGPSPWGRNPWR